LLAPALAFYQEESKMKCVLCGHTIFGRKICKGCEKKFRQEDVAEKTGKPIRGQHKEKFNNLGQNLAELQENHNRNCGKKEWLVD
jgi:hypothetical protein